MVCRVHMVFRVGSPPRERNKLDSDLTLSHLTQKLTLLESVQSSWRTETKGWVKFRTPVRITSIVRLGVCVWGGGGGGGGGQSRGRYNFEKSKNTKMKNEK